VIQNPWAKCHRNDKTQIRHIPKIKDRSNSALSEIIAVETKNSNLGGHFPQHTPWEREHWGSRGRVDSHLCIARLRQVQVQVRLGLNKQTSGSWSSNFYGHWDGAVVFSSSLIEVRAEIKGEWKLDSME